MIHIHQVDLTYESTDGTRVHALETIDLQVAENQFVVIVGPSACGKSTFLKEAEGSASSGLRVPGSFCRVRDAERLLNGLGTMNSKPGTINRMTNWRMRTWQIS